MDTLFAGSFETDVTARELIARVIATHPEGTSFLRINDSGNTVSGRIYLKDGELVTGAVVLPDVENNYPALKTLLAIKEGNFALIAVTPEDEIKSDQSLNIDLLALLELIDQLPSDPNEIVEQKQSPAKPAFEATPGKLGSALSSIAATSSSGSIKLGGSLARPTAGRETQEAEAPDESQNGHEDGLEDGQPPVDIELKKLLENRFTKSLSSGSEGGRASSNFTRSRKFQQSGPLGNPASLAIGAIALCLLATLVWKFSDATALAQRFLPKTFLSSPNPPAGEVSSIKVKTSAAPAHRKKPE
jgi:hypothetical protein